MSDAFLGEVRMFAGNYPPAGSAFCNGAVLPIAGNESLFALIGNDYGGDGRNTFALPDLRGRAPVHRGAGPGLSTYTVGSHGGVEQVTLTSANLPPHTHPLNASTVPGGAVNPQGRVPAASPSVDLYLQDVPSVALAPAAISPVGGSQPHENRPAYLAVNYIICLSGIFPTQD